MSNQQSSFTNNDRRFDRLPPHDIAAEKCVLGAMMMTGDDVQAFAEMSVVLKTESFFLADHRAIFDAIIAQQIDAGKVDAVLVKARLRTTGHLDEIGGPGYIAELLDSVPSYTHGVEYAKCVAKTAAWRSIITSASAAIDAAYAQSDDPASIAGNTIDRLLSVSAEGVADRVITMQQAIESLRESLASNKPRRIPTGIKIFDVGEGEAHGVGGLPIGKLTVIAGRPAMGKSLLAKQIARNFASTGSQVGIVSIEEDRLKIAENAVAGESGVDNRKINQVRLTNEERQRVYDASERVQSLQIFIVDSVTTLSDVEAAITTVAMRHRCKLVVVDHLHLIDAETPKGSDRNRDVTKITGRLKAIAKRLGIALVVCAQLNRGSEHAEERPDLKELRDSGSIEQDADLVLMLYRADYYASKRDKDHVPDNVLEILIRKNKDGCVGTIPVAVNLRMQWVYDPDDCTPTTFVSEEEDRSRVNAIFGSV